MASFFFVSSTRSVHFFVQLELRTSKTYSKRQNRVQNKNMDVQNLENIGPPFGVFHSDFFGTLRLFLKYFRFHQRVSPSFVSIFCNTMDVKNPQRVHFYIFRHCNTVQNLILKFFRILKKSPKGLPFIFFIFCNLLAFHKAQRVPLLQF